MPAVFLPFFFEFPPDLFLASAINALKRHTNYGFVFAVFFASVQALSAQPTTSPGVIRGTVVDAATGAPLTRVLVSDEDSAATSVTGVAGRFELQTPSGLRRLRASVVGYAVAQRDVPVTAGIGAEVVIRLAGGTGGYEESVTVSADRFQTADPGAPAQQVLGSAGIQNLRGVLADDPLRAVQGVPGVATGDDLRTICTSVRILAPSERRASRCWRPARARIYDSAFRESPLANMRYHPPPIDPRTFEARRLFESLLPVVPSAGVLIEF